MHSFANGVMDGNPLKLCQCCSCCSVFIGFILAIWLSFSSLEYTEFGLNYSWLSMTVEGQGKDHKGYTAGLYFLGFGHSFIKFPATVQSIEFSSDHDHNAHEDALRSRTLDGLEVALEISFQYQLNASSIYYVYEKFGLNYEPIYVNYAVDLLTQMATKYTATFMFANRSVISFDMESELSSHFNDELYARVAFFQLRSVSLPKAFEKAIQETEVAKQSIQTATAEKGNKEVQMHTAVLQAQQQSKSIGLNANATAQSTLLQAKAYVAQFNTSQTLQAESFRGILDKFGGNGSLLLEYMRVRAMRDHPNELMVVNMPQS